MFDGPTEKPCFILYAPIYLSRTYDKTWSVNLNEYRNTHYQTLNKLKAAFRDFMKEQIEELPKFKTIQLTYTLFFGSERDVDTNNVCAVVDKFFCDALKEYGCIEDDNRRILTKTTFQFGEVDKHNPRCEVQITGDIMETDMKIIYEPSEVSSVVAEYVRNDKDLIIRAIEADITSKFSLSENQRLDIKHTVEGATVRIIDKAKDVLPGVAAKPRLEEKLNAGNQAAKTKPAPEPVAEPQSAPETAPEPEVEAEPAPEPEAAPEPAPAPEQVTESPKPKVGLFANLKGSGSPAPGEDQAAGEPAPVAEAPKDPARSLFSLGKKDA